MFQYFNFCVFWTCSERGTPLPSCTRVVASRRTTRYPVRGVLTMLTVVPALRCCCPLAAALGTKLLPTKASVSHTANNTTRTAAKNLIMM